MTPSISSSTVNDWSTALFSRLDTKNQGYIDKSDVESAFAKTAKGTAGSADTEAADTFFDQVDTDKDGKVSKSELSTAISKVADELNAQFDQARVAKGGGHGGPPPGGGAGGPPPAGGSDDGGTDSSSATSTYSAAADTNGDGTVSAEEAAAYAQLQAAGSATASLSGSSTSSTTVSASTGTGTATGASAGLSKDQLTDRLNALDGSDSRHAGALKKLVDNFDKADTNGDGKLSRSESRAYLKSTREAGKGQAGGTGSTDGADSAGRGPADALARALDLLKAYVNNSQDTQSTSSSASSTISTQA